MKEDRFIRENSETWTKLQNILKKLKSKGFTKVSNNDLHDFISLYNSSCGHLSYSRTNYGSTNTTAYLNRLVSAAHSYIYAGKSSNFRKCLNFFFVEFPLLVKKNLIFLIVAMAIFFTGFFYSFITTLISDENASAYLPQSVITKMETDNSGKAVIDASQGSLISSMIFTNNIKVAVTSFAAGVTVVGTVLMLLYNSTSTVIGSLAALGLIHGTGTGLWSLLLPHGFLEMFCIFLCGAAGLKIGFAIIAPGKYSRKDSLIINGRIAIKLVAGASAILVVAGLIEGFFTPMDIDPHIKLYFAFFTLLLLLFYLIFPNILQSRGLKHKNKSY